MAKQHAKIFEFEDINGHRLPQNISQQFRGVQSGIEYLKDAADEITTELKVVSTKLGSNTTDLKTITDKVNSIESKLTKHMKETQKAFKSSEKTTQSILNVLEFLVKKK
jgi:predicted  nucleic acid-binding Zn-ribbon protein